MQLLPQQRLEPDTPYMKVIYFVPALLYRTAAGIRGKGDEFG
jgi:hypothetical protein